MTSDTDKGNWEAEILEQLDRCAKTYDFPMLNNAYLCNADIRLTAFLSSAEWLIVFEEVAYSTKHLFINSVSAYGNRIIRPGTQQAISIVTGVPGKPLHDEWGNFLLDKSSFEIVIHGQVRRFTPTAEDYRRAGISSDSKMVVPAQILRLLVFLNPEFFLTEVKLLETCGRADSDLELFIKLDDWYHPDIANDELPSQSLCLRSLAIALNRNDKGLYTCSHEVFNTDWSNWESAST